MTAGNGASGFDLANLATVDTIKHVVLSPRDGKPIISYGEPWTITLAGPAHEATVRAEQERYRKMLDLAVVHGEDKMPETVALSLVIRAVAVRMIAWTPIDLAEQRKIECTPDNAEEMLRIAAWLYADLSVALERRTAFLVPSQGEPATTLDTSSESPSATRKVSRSRRIGVSAPVETALVETNSAPS